MINKNRFSEADIKEKFITPALIRAGWDERTQIVREYAITAGRIWVKGKLTARGKKLFADYVLYISGIPVAIIEAKDNNHSLNSGIQQALKYSNLMDIPFAFCSNGDGFYFHDKTTVSGEIETSLNLDSFPSPQTLWEKYKRFRDIKSTNEEKIILQAYFADSNRKPRYYQQIAINRTIEAVAKGKKRILLVMATGTGKTYTAFQIAYRLFKSKSKRKILFLADRTSLIDQTLRGDFRHFKDAMTIIKKKVINIEGKDILVSTSKRGIDNADKAFDIFLGLYQGLSNSDPEVPDAFKDFSPDYFDLIIVDECHRGSAREDSKWRAILDYFNSATHIGLTATPKETKEISNIDYFKDPIYTYSLKQGIDDGFLAPYKVVKVTLDIDADGWRPPQGFTDKEGNLVEDRIYNTKDFDKNIIFQDRRKLVANKITEFLKLNNRFDKTIVFCVDIEHAEGMRAALANANSDLVRDNNKYVMQITGDNEEGKRELDNFINPGERYPVIAVTSKLMTTGVDAQTCKLIVLDTNIGSITEFKQIIGRGTRINEEYGKFYFTIMDFRNVTNHFADPDFDGDPVSIIDIEGDGPIVITDPEPTEEVEDPDFPEPDYPEPNPDEVNDPKVKLVKKVVSGVDVKIINERIQYLGADGKIITESLIDYTKKNINNQYKTLESFLQAWNKSDKKKAIIEELEDNGIFFDILNEEVGKEFDPFDLVCHVAFEMPALTRRDRANNVKKRNYFSKYSQKAQIILSTLLDKYADDGVLTIESLEVLKLKPINELGTPVELIKAFGGKSQYELAIKELEQELYRKA